MLEQEAQDLPRALINTLHMPAHHTLAVLLPTWPQFFTQWAHSLSSLNNEKLACAPNAGPLSTSGINLYSDGAYMINVAPSEKERALLKPKSGKTACIMEWETQQGRNGFESHCSQWKGEALSLPVCNHTWTAANHATGSSLLNHSAAADPTLPSNI